MPEPYNKPLILTCICLPNVRTSRRVLGLVRGHILGTPGRISGRTEAFLLQALNTCYEFFPWHNCKTKIFFVFTWSNLSHFSFMISPLKRTVKRNCALLKKLCPVKRNLCLAQDHKDLLFSSINSLVLPFTLGLWPILN